MKTRVRAVIINENKLLLIHRIKSDKEYWVFPGGGVEIGETMEEALARECTEELNVKVEIIDKFCEVRSVNKVELFFNCKITSGTIKKGSGPEFRKGTLYKGKYIINYIPLDELSRYNILPKAVKNKILEKYF